MPESKTPIGRGSLMQPERGRVRVPLQPPIASWTPADNAEPSREKAWHYALHGCIVVGMPDGSCTSVILWRGKSLPCSTSFIQWLVIRLQRPKLLVLSLVIFCVFVFGFSLQGMRPEETAVPSPTPAVQSAVASPTPMGPRPYVGSVGIHTWKEIRGQSSVYAQRGDEIWVDIYNLERWRRELENERKLPDQNGIKDLVLYLNHRPLARVAPVSSYETPALTARSNDEPPVAC